MKHRILATALFLSSALGSLTSCGPEIEGRLTEAGDLLTSGRAADAARLLEGMDPRVQADARVRVLLARAYAADFRFAEADAALRQGLAADPTQDSLREALEGLETSIYRKAVQFHEAEQALEARRLLDDLAQRESQPDAAFLGRLGRVYQAIGELAPAEAALRRGVALDPTHPEVIDGLVGVYSQLGLYEKARGVLMEAREAGLADEHSAIALGVCHGRLGDLDQARAEFTRAAAAGADPKVLDYNLALLLVADGKDHEALETLEALVQGEDPQPSAKRQYARLLIDMNPSDKESIDRALLMAWEVVDELPEDWRAYEVIGDAYFLLEDYPAAKGAFYHALQFSRNKVSTIEEKWRQNETKLLELEGGGDASEGR